MPVGQKTTDIATLTSEEQSIVEAMFADGAGAQIVAMILANRRTRAQTDAQFVQSFAPTFGAILNNLKRQLEAKGSTESYNHTAAFWA